MRRHITETILGFHFWTLFQALAPMIWFYPLNDLEISGYEAYALVLFSPILLGFPYIGNLLRNKWVVMLLRLCSLLGLLSFQASRTLDRLYLLSFGCFTNMIVFTTAIFDKPHREKTITGLLLGLLLFISSRIWFTSFNPAWWNVSSNTAVTTICCVATLDQLLFDFADAPKTKNIQVRNNWFVMGLGFGSFLYTTQAIFGEVSVLARWTVAGYPDTGPMPFPSGLFVLLSLTIGAYMSFCEKVTRSFLWWAVGCCSLASVYYLKTWNAFLGGIVLAAFVTSISQLMLQEVSRCFSPCKLMFVAMLTWLVEMLFSVWTVAYNFVPGGVYTRERTDVLLIFIIFTFILAVISINSNKVQIHDKHSNTGKDNNISQMILFFILLFGIGGFAYRLPKQKFIHKLEPPKVFTSAIWTFHFGYDNEGWPSLLRAASALRESQADVITLLESDASKPFLGNNDLAMWLGEELSMYVDFGPSTRDHTWGNLILSKYPIISSKHHLLPSPHGELAPAITATIDMDGDLVTFVVTHMGNDGDVIDRDLQAKFLANELKNTTNPVVFLGYVTSAPFSRDYEQLTKFGNVKDIDSTDKDRWCEYIMYRNLQRLGYARISHGGLSDTEIQVARFRIPIDPSSYQDNNKIITDPSKIPQNIRFSPKFGGYKNGHNWERNHKYHMGTPKYFN